MSKNNKINKKSGSKTNNKIHKNNIVWRSVGGFTKYDVSSDGQIKNTWTDKILLQQINNGYYTVQLQGDGENKNYQVNVLVAKAFLPNPNNLKEVDHINNNRLDNNVKNLRWITHPDNIKSFCDNFKKYRKILQYDKDDNLIKKWKSMTELLKNNPKFRRGAIYTYIRNKSSKLTYGYKWAADPPIEPKVKIKNITEFKTIGMISGRDFSNYKIHKNGKLINHKNEIMTPTYDKNGYARVHLCDKNNIGHSYMCRIHRLVAHVYCKNVEINKIQVNHKDKNRANNNNKNLEWMTPQENIIHAMGKMVKMIDPNTDTVLKVFRCVKDADCYLEVSTNSHIGEVCNGKWKTYRGYKWAWVEPNEKINLPIIAMPYVNKKKVVEV